MRQFSMNAIMVALLSLGLGFSVSTTTIAAERKPPASTQKSKVKQPPAKNKSTAAKKDKKESATQKSGKTLAKSSIDKQPAATKKVIARRSAKKTPNIHQPEDQHLAVQSGFALVVDQNGGEALFQKNASTVVPIASITKLMTAMVVLDGSPSMQTPITITDDDVDYLRSSRSRLHVGSVLTRETALLLALMSSENRAAHALARHYPGGKSAFIAAMNIKAQALGMRDSHFEDPTGLTINNVSTARDLAKMVAAAHRYPLIREFSTTPEATIEIAGHEMAYHNTNPLVKSAAWDVGLSKTGYINEAGKCLVMLARVAQKPVVIVLLDSAGKQTRVGDANRIKRWMENTLAARKEPTRASYTAEAGRPG